jgi:hypothetical protein
MESTKAIYPQAIRKPFVEVAGTTQRGAEKPVDHETKHLCASPTVKPSTRNEASGNNIGPNNAATDGIANNSRTENINAAPATSLISKTRRGVVADGGPSVQSVPLIAVFIETNPR